MWGNKLIEEMIENANPDRQEQMMNYMRNQFKFLGIQALERQNICRPYFASAKKSGKIDWDFVYLCWENDYREMQYIAIDYLKSMKKFLKKDDIERLEELIINKSWWDTVDNFNKIIGYLVDKYEDLKELVLDWSLCENIWLRRMSIIYQLTLKEDTDLSILTKVIDNNLYSDEFFINKAIGWSLRQYSKIDPEWVKEFIEERKNKLDRLSIKEGSKYL